MCDKPVDDCLASLKFVPDWFVTIWHRDENVLYFNEDSGNVIFYCR